MRIKVQWRDILMGHWRNPQACAVALATQRQVPDLVSVHVSRRRMECVFYRNGTGWTTKQANSPNMASRIRFWDRWHIIRPFEFELRLSPVVTVKDFVAPREVLQQMEAELAAVC